MKEKKWVIILLTLPLISLKKRMMAEPIKAIKILNNSLVLSSDADNNEIIVMGKGIGFNSKTGDILDPTKIEKTFILKDGTSPREFARLIEHVGEEYVHIVNKIIDDANRQLHGRLSEQVFFTLIDHISFAIERYRKGISIQNRLLYEVKRFYPQEFAIASRALNDINQQMNLELPEEEAGNIAFHLVNAQTDVQNMENTLQSVKMLKDIFNIIQYNFHIVIDKESINYSRFLTHMQFFIQRLLENSLIHSNDDFIFEQVTKEYPDAYKCSRLIKDYIHNLLNIDISNDEMLYLIIHIVRITPEQENAPNRR